MTDQFATMECGNCQRCGQRRVLGRMVKGEGLAAPEVFNCGACVDRYCDDDCDMVDVEVTTEIAPESINMRMDVPAALAEVPEGQLQTERHVIWNSECAGHQDTITVVTDPENNYFRGHGSHLWPASKLLARYLLTRPVQGLTVVELGCGCGLPGIVAARQGARVTLTDLPWVLPLTGYNCDANFPEGDPRRPRLATLRWGSTSDAASITADGKPDLVIGADIIYKDEDLPALFKTVRALGGTEFILAFLPREDMMRTFTRHIMNLGMKAESLGWEQGTSIVKLRTDLGSYISGGA